MTESRRDLETRVGSPLDAFGPRSVVFSDGVLRGQRGVELSSGAGLDVLILPDRSGDIVSLRWRGVELGFQSKTGAGNRGAGDLHASFSGFLVTCGLQNAGPADGDQPFHGRQPWAPASELRTGAAWEEDRLVSTVEMSFRESRLFGENLELRRTWRLEHGADRILLQDTVRNSAFEPATVLLLYHVNFGHPLLSEAARLEVDGTPVPRDEPAAAGLEKAMEMGAPEPGRSEEVFFYERVGRAAVANPDLGIRVELQWETGVLPYLTEWKCLRAGDYALGLEPATCHPLGRSEALARGQGLSLDPGQEATVRLEIRIR